MALLSGGGSRSSATALGPPPMIARLFAVFLCVTALQAAPILTVAPGGELPSLEAARDQLRNLRKGGQSGPAIIQIEGGLYEQIKAMVLDAQDSDLTITAVHAASPKYLGAVKAMGYGPYKDNILKADDS